MLFPVEPVSFRFVSDRSFRSGDSFVGLLTVLYVLTNVSDYGPAASQVVNHGGVEFSLAGKPQFEKDQQQQSTAV